MIGWRLRGGWVGWLVGVSVTVVLSVVIGGALAGAAHASRNPFPDPHPKAGRRVERKLHNEAYKLCVGRELYIEDGVPLLVCYHADASCWWREHPYHNYKCWNTYWMHYRAPGDKRPWNQCVRGAWGDQLGRVTRRQAWRCDWQRFGPPNYAGVRRVAAGLSTAPDTSPEAEEERDR